LHIWSSGVGIEVNVGKGDGLWVSSGQEILDDNSFSCTGVTNEQDWFSSADTVSAKLLKSAGLDGMDQNL
jgi:hypothetical protein